MFSINTQISNFMKIGPVGTELFIADGRTDGVTKLRAGVCNFSNVPKKNGVRSYPAVLSSGMNFLPLDVTNNMTARLLHNTYDATSPLV